MHVSRIQVGFTKNIGNFQSLRCEVAVELGAEDDFDLAILAASGVMNDALDLPVDPAMAAAVAMLANKRYSGQKVLTGASVELSR